MAPTPKLSVTRRPGSYVYLCLEPSSAAPLLAHAQATVVEDEGLTIVISAEQARAAGLPIDGEFGWLTVEAQTSLLAVGITATLSAVLSEAGIACNVLAGNFHDHLLVPLDRAKEAARLLADLAD